MGRREIPSVAGGRGECRSSHDSARLCGQPEGLAWAVCGSGVVHGGVASHSKSGLTAAAWAPVRLSFAHTLAGAHTSAARVRLRTMAASDAGSTRPGFGPGSSSKKRRSTDIENTCGELLQDIYEESIKQIVTLLRAEPTKTLPCLRLVKGNSLLPKVADTNSGGETPFNPSYTKMYRLPKEDARSMLITCKPEVDDAMWHDIEKAEDGATRAVFYYIHGVTEGTKWPKQALDRAVFRAMFERVRTKLGDRINDLTTFRNEQHQLKINWKTFGYFRLIPQGAAEKLQVLHLPSGKRACIADMHIKDDKYHIKYNWNECKAEVHYGKLKQTVLDSFDTKFISETERRNRDADVLWELPRKLWMRGRRRRTPRP